MFLLTSLERFGSLSFVRLKGDLHEQDCREQRSEVIFDRRFST